MKMAMDMAGMPIDYINAHATSTPAGDAPEITAIREVFGGADKVPPLSATKGLTGHAPRRGWRLGIDLFDPDDEREIYRQERQYL